MTGAAHKEGFSRRGNAGSAGLWFEASILTSDTDCELRSLEHPLALNYDLRAWNRSSPDFG